MNNVKEKIAIVCVIVLVAIGLFFVGTAILNSRYIETKTTHFGIVLVVDCRLGAAVINETGHHIQYGIDEAKIGCLVVASYLQQNVTFITEYAVATGNWIVSMEAA